MSTAGLAVQGWGVATSVVDAGRPGRAAYGASRGGAADLRSLHLANRLVGNAVDARALETSGGLVVVAEQATMVVVTGALGHVTVQDGPPVGWGSPVVLPAGSRLQVGRLVDGARLYLAVRGGLQVEGDRLAIGADPGAPAATQAAFRSERRAELRVWPGPRRDWFTTTAWDLLIGQPYTVSPASDRVGLRLQGPLLRRRVDGELLSEGLLEGAIQVPPDGHPIVMLADHPVTGGYPVIAVLDPADVGEAAQAPAGSVLRFRTAR
jgi:allophanate hydrolase subunit 2